MHRLLGKIFTYQQGAFGSGFCFALPRASLHLSTMHRAPQLGRKPRHLQLKVTRCLTYMFHNAPAENHAHERSKIAVQVWRFVADDLSSLYLYLVYNAPQLCHCRFIIILNVDSFNICPQCLNLGFNRFNS